MTNNLLRMGCLALLTGLLLSCGGGGGGGGAAFGSAGTAGLVAGSSSGEGSSPFGGPGDGQGGNVSSAAGNSTTASTDDGSGVGSGGTGVSTADAAGIGTVDGAGSIIVSGLRYNTDAAVLSILDASALQLGMSVKVTGPVNADFTSGIARQVDSAADIRGPLSSVNLAEGSFVIMGTTVTTDEATVWADATGLAAMAPGATLQVWGLPAAPGFLRATRVEQRGPSAPILTGTVQDLDTARRVFTLGGLVVDYRNAILAGGLGGLPLANGTIVRVRANGASPGSLPATLVQWWYPVPAANATPVQLAGVVTDYAGLGSLRVLGVTVDASAAQVTGGPAGSVGNGVKLDVGGLMFDGILRATKVKVRHVPGMGGPASFTLIGSIGSFASPSSFRVRGQPVDAGGPAVVFINGTASSLGNGVGVIVDGAQVVNGVLIATRVTFE